MAQTIHHRFQCASGLFLLIWLCVPLRAQSSPDLGQQVAELRALVERLQGRVAELEARVPGNAVAAKALPQASTTAAPALPAPASPGAQPTELAGTTINFLVDGYYGYNFNAPIGRANRLRAYDVTSNSFSINQAGLVLENAPDPARGKRWGARLDLQWGQATQTLQGNTANESRPEIYRDIFQAYGTYIAPLGKGLQVDFGKWASSKVGIGKQLYAGPDELLAILLVRLPALLSYGRACELPILRQVRRELLDHQRDAADRSV